MLRSQLGWKNDTRHTTTKVRKQHAKGSLMQLKGMLDAANATENSAVGEGNKKIKRAKQLKKRRTLNFSLLDQKPHPPHALPLHLPGVGLRLRLLH
jgi:hypothetical protein